MISCYAGPEQLAKYVSFAWSVERSFFCACGSGSRRLQRGQTRELVSHLRHLRTQPVKDCDSCLFGAWREFARGAHTGRATLFAFAGRNQLARFLHQQIVSAKKGLGKADPARISVVEVEIRLEEFLGIPGNRILHADRCE